MARRERTNNTMARRERTDNTMARRERTDNTMARRERTDNTMARRERTDNTMARRERTKRKLRLVKEPFQQLMKSTVFLPTQVVNSSERLSSPPVFCGVRVTRFLALCLMFCRSLFVLSLLAIVLSVLSLLAIVLSVLSLLAIVLSVLSVLFMSCCNGSLTNLNFLYLRTV
jgi:Flp pilus assembly protein TadB